MKNKLLILLSFVGFAANAQELNKKIEDQIKHKEVMLNQCTKEGIINFPEFKASYDANYGNYKVDSTQLKDLKKLAGDKKITVVMGTWCGDSKLQVPHFIKIADALHIDKNVTFICVDGNKKAENGLIDNLKIERVPTFIFFDKKGQELGRITESPKKSLEIDMKEILTAKTK